ncbi:MAG TPA: hypothetical protein PK529_13055, partial [Verrucomicrobiales bacterium]|nr:hypothetical protein [Verrucomicrobiales bacterium]
MRNQAILLCLLLCASTKTFAQDNHPWETPELRLLNDIAVTSMEDYTEWSKGFRRAGLPPSEADWAVNRMTEKIVIRLLKPLGDHPNPALLRECLYFLGEEVPEAFDNIWRLVLLEMSSNIDPKVGNSYDVELAESGRNGLKQRAMRGASTKP